MRITFEEHFLNVENSRPIQVYLGSSDFSVMANPKSRTPDIIDTESRLLAWQNLALTELRFSYAHVIEAAPTRQDSVDLAVLTQT